MLRIGGREGVRSRRLPVQNSKKMTRLLDSIHSSLPGEKVSFPSLEENGSVFLTSLFSLMLSPGCDSQMLRLVTLDLTAYLAVLLSSPLSNNDTRSPSWEADARLPSCKHFEELTSLVYELPSLWGSATAAKHGIHEPVNHGVDAFR